MTRANVESTELVSLDSSSSDVTRNQEFEASIRSYLVHLKIERNLSKNTILAYERDLRSFRIHLEQSGITSTHQVTSAEIADWLQALSRTGMKSASQARMLVAVRGFWKWFSQELGSGVSPAELLAVPKIQRQLPVLADEEVALHLLSAAESTKDEVLVALLYGSGLRVSEVVDLDLGDLHLEGLVMRVRGKGAKERVVPLGEIVADKLRAYVATERTQHNRALEVDAVFPGRSAKGRISRQAIFLRLKKLALKAGIDPEAVSPHKLRHGYATDLIRGGADIRAIQVLLGHSDLRTTEIYTRIDDKHLRETYDRTHPRR